jgi:hypothetical protein
MGTDAHMHTEAMSWDLHHLKIYSMMIKSSTLITGLIVGCLASTHIKCLFPKDQISQTLAEHSCQPMIKCRCSNRWVRITWWCIMVWTWWEDQVLSVLLTLTHYNSSNSNSAWCLMVASTHKQTKWWWCHLWWCRTNSSPFALTFQTLYRIKLEKL